MTKLLIVYATHLGHTRKVVERICAVLNSHSCEVELLVPKPGTDYQARLGEGYAKVLLIAPVRYGHHLPQMVRFIKAHTKALSSLNAGFVSINLTARKADKNTAQSNPYMRKFLAKIDWQPTFQGVVAGALTYKRYPWFDRFMICLIMKMTGGPTDMTKDYDFTDWPGVDRFALSLLND